MYYVSRPLLLPFNLCPLVDVAQLMVLGHFLHHVSVLYQKEMAELHAQSEAHEGERDRRVVHNLT